MNDTTIVTQGGVADNETAVWEIDVLCKRDDTGTIWQQTFRARLSVIGGTPSPVAVSPIGDPDRPNGWVGASPRLSFTAVASGSFWQLQIDGFGPVAATSCGWVIEPVRKSRKALP